MPYLSHGTLHTWGLWHDTPVLAWSPCRRKKWSIEGDQSGIEIISTSSTRFDVQSWFLISITATTKPIMKGGSDLFWDSGVPPYGPLANFLTTHQLLSSCPMHNWSCYHSPTEYKYYRIKMVGDHVPYNAFFNLAWNTHALSFFATCHYNCWDPIDSWDMINIFSSSQWWTY